MKILGLRPVELISSLAVLGVMIVVSSDAAAKQEFDQRCADGFKPKTLPAGQCS